MDEVVLQVSRFSRRNSTGRVFVRLDSANPRRRHDDDGRSFVREELVNRKAIRQIKFGPGAGQQAGKSLRTQLAQDGAADETAMASDEDRFVLFHQVLGSIRLAFPFSSHCAILTWWA